jgi:hypothetical protein
MTTLNQGLCRRWNKNPLILFRKEFSFQRLLPQGKLNQFNIWEHQIPFPDSGRPRDAFG